MKAKTKDELQEEMQTLRDELMKSEAVVSALTQGGTGTATRLVPIKNFSSNLVSIPYEYQGLKTGVLLEPIEGRDVASIPVDVWHHLEKTSTLIQKGFVARLDMPIDNPNVIEDIDAFMAESDEESFRARVGEMTTDSCLYRLLYALEQKEEKTGKELSALAVLRERLFEVCSVRITDGDID
jgi:hypothetical protein